MYMYIYIRVHVELSTLHSMVATRFPGSNISIIATSPLVTDVFPNVRLKRVGKKKVSILVSIELRHQPSVPFPSPSPPDKAGSPHFPCTSSSLSEATKVTALQLELAVERNRREALELERVPRCKVQHRTRNLSIQR